MDKTIIDKMLAVAIKTEKFAYIFKSVHKFGAAVLTTDGTIFGGCNMDGVISNLGCCAETMALHSAVVNGKYEIEAVLIVDEEKFIYPCGSCLQVMCQFQQSSPNPIKIISAKTNGEYQVKLLEELFPKPFYSRSFADKLSQFKNH